MYCLSSSDVLRVHRRNEATESARPARSTDKTRDQLRQVDRHGLVARVDAVRRRRRRGPVRCRVKYCQQWCIQASSVRVMGTK